MERIILDVDTGLDDAVALFLAAGLQEFTIEAVIATAGNVGLEKTLENTLNILETAGIRCPVYKGADKPLVRKPVQAGDFHGKSGLDGPVFAPRKFQRAQEEDGIDALIRLVKAMPHQISIVSVGPLTDLALAFRKDPAVALLCKQIVVMGGSFSQGNVTEHAEFNAFADPEAASLVFSSGAKLVLFPLDCTRRVTLSPARLADFQRRKGRSTAVFCSCMESYTANYTKRGQGQPQMHDPLCVAYLVDPSKVETEYCRVEVDTNPGQTYGKTTKTPTNSDGGVLVAKNIDIPWFWTLVDRSLANLP